MYVCTCICICIRIFFMNKWNFELYKVFNRMQKIFTAVGTLRANGIIVEKYTSFFLNNNEPQKKKLLWTTEKIIMNEL